MRLFGLRNDHAEDVHRADANRLGEKKALNKLAREIKSQPVKLQFWSDFLMPPTETMNMGLHREA